MRLATDTPDARSDDGTVAPTQEVPAAAGSRAAAIAIWSAVLDRLGDRLADQRAALDAVEAASAPGLGAALDGLDLTPFRPEPGLPPLPAECADHARRLLAANDDLVARVEALLRRRRPSTIRHRPAARGTAGRFEFRA